MPNDYSHLTKEQLILLVLRRNRQVGHAMKRWDEEQKRADKEQARADKLEDEIVGLLHDSRYW